MQEFELEIILRTLNNLLEYVLIKNLGNEIFII